MSISTGSCATNQYIKQINADGTVVCANVPYHWGVTCSAGQVIQSISSAGVPTCVSKGANMACGAGQMMTGVYANGNPICSAVPNQVLNMSCPYGQQMVGISNNNPICRNRLECRMVIGPWQLTGSVAWCNPDEYAVGGGFETEVGGSLGFAHVSVPGGSNWSTDSSRFDRDNLARAYAVCCK